MSTARTLPVVNPSPSPIAAPERVFAVDPLTDARWPDLVQRHPKASVFHTSAWLGALERTYGYEPVAFTTCAPDRELENAIVFCDVRSWLTGRRLVSLPFSDHCDPLTTDARELNTILRYVEAEQRRRRWRYVELRPQLEGGAGELGFGASEQFWLHRLDLRGGEQTLFRSFSKDSIQRKIHRAEREGVGYEEGRSDELLNAFYRLLVITRRRHSVPPQPLTWFKNLVINFGTAAKIRVAQSGGRPIAAILTLSHCGTMVYKYGASDAAFHRLGCMQLLFWKTIQDALSSSHSVLDFGRSDTDNEGLAVFKDRWGAVRSSLTYWQYPLAKKNGALRTFAISGAKQVLARVPDSCRRAAGRVLYKHAG
jgi:CelD/BcsL family acetyltransferase involved in cellulose biosynthesis